MEEVTGLLPSWQIFSNPWNDFPNLMSLRSIKPAGPSAAKKPPWETWQYPVVPLRCSLLNVSAYCGFLILSHNLLVFWGLVLFILQFQMCVLSWLSPHVTLDAPQHIHPLFLRSQSFSVLWSGPAAPAQQAAHSQPSAPTSFNPFCGFWAVVPGWFNIYWGPRDSCWNTHVHLSLPA